MNKITFSDINHRRNFAMEIHVSLFETMREGLKVELVATKERRPLSLTFDKMTPSEKDRTGSTVIMPVSENQLSLKIGGEVKQV